VPRRLPAGNCGKRTSAAGNPFQRSPRRHTTKPPSGTGRERLCLCDGRTENHQRRRHRLSNGRMEEESWIFGIRRRRMRGARASRTRSRARCRADVMVLKAGVANAPRPCRVEIRKKKRPWRCVARKKLGSLPRSRSRITWGCRTKTVPGNKSWRHHQEDRRRRQWAMPATIEDPKVLDETATR